MFGEKLITFWKSTAWSLFVLFVFLLPSDNLSKAPSVPYLAEAVHFIMFSILTWLLYHDMLRNRAGIISFGKHSLIALCVGLTFGIVIEILQELSGLGRKAEFKDVLFDLGGIIASIGILWLLFLLKQNTDIKD